ncbi:MAG: hypothetical protein K2H07_05160, partial [Lachnospiraceae bacterium]|nr:hypothetical protein [Lachnospiraceae bacterium]
LYLKRDYDVTKSIGLSDYTNYNPTDMFISDLYYEDRADGQRKPLTNTVSTDTVSKNLGSIVVYFTARRLSYNVRITNGLAGDTLKKAYINDNPVKADATTGVITFTVPDDAWATANGFGRLGYTYEGIRNASGQLIGKGSTFSYTTDPDNDTALDLEIVADFKPVEDIEIEYDARPAGYEFINITGEQVHKSAKKTYTDTVKLPTAADMTGWAENDGYVLVGWKDMTTNTIYEPGEEVPVSQLCVPTGNITDIPNVKGKKIEAVWDYKRVTLVGNIVNDATGKNIVTTEGNGLIVTAQYGDSISGSFYPVYLTDVTAGTSSNFTCKISDVDDVNIASYGVKITNITNNGADNVVGFIIGMPYEHVVKKTGSITIPVEITDKNTTKEDGTSIVTTCN